MHKFLEKIQSYEQKPYVIKNFISSDEVKLFQKLYNELPVEINNRRQKIIKKKWSVDFDVNLQKIYLDKLRLNLDNFKMDNPKTKDGKDV